MTPTHRRLVLMAAPALAALGCPGQRVDGPPPAESLEIVSAAPGALGAFAGGTDAAPPVVQPTPDEALEEGEAPVPALDGGIPEAGPEMPENLPL